MIERFPETVVAEMGRVEDEMQAIHLGEQLAAARSERAGGVRSLRVGARTVVGRAHRAQTLAVRALQMARRDQGIGALEAEQVAN